MVGVNLGSKLWRTSRATMPILGAFVALAAVEFSYFPGRDSSLHVAALRAKGVALAELTAGSIAPALEFEDDSVLLEFLNGVVRDRDVARVMACTASGTPLQVVGRTTGVARCPRVTSTQVDIIGSLLVVSTPVSSKSHPGVLSMALRTDDIAAARRDAQRVALGIAAGILILGFVVTGWIGRILGQLQRLLEENRTARARAEAASAAKSAFLANMSHEIRTPMNGVIGLTQLLEKGPLDETQRRHVRTIARSGEVLMAVINDILDFSKIEAGKLMVNSAPLDLHVLLSEVADSVRATAEQKAIALELEIDVALPRAVSSDSIRLRQVLLNLLVNAVKFTSQGSVRLSARCDGDGGAEQRVRFEVRDTGIGISQADQAKLFEAFSQVDDQTTRRYGGTGLGLAICRRLVTLMNGELGVKSEPGVGSTFWVVLPLLVVDRVSVVPISGNGVAVAQGGGPRLLAVDDNEINRGVMEHLAASLGYAVELVDGGRLAIERVTTSGPYALVLMDCQMPDVDGYMATREIRAWEQRTNAPRTPIVAVTAHAMDGEEQKVRDAGMDDYLAKPVRLASLRSLVEKWTGRTVSAPPPSAADAVTRV